MLNELRRRQVAFLTLLLIGGPATGIAMAVVYEGWFLPWWQRALVVLLALVCATVGGAAYDALSNLRKQINDILKVMRANQGSPTAPSLHTPPARADNNDLGSFDIFGRRRGA